MGVRYVEEVDAQQDLVGWRFPPLIWGESWQIGDKTKVSYKSIVFAFFCIGNKRGVVKIRGSNEIDGAVDTGSQGAWKFSDYNCC